MSEEILRPIPYLDYSLAGHPEWFFYERAFFTSGKHQGKVVKERDVLPHRDTVGDRAKIWKSNHNVSRNIIEVPARETWCDMRDVLSDGSGKCLNGKIVLSPWRCGPHDAHNAKLTKPVTDKSVLKALNMVLSGHNAYRGVGDPGVYVAILIGTGAPYIRWSLERSEAGHPHDFYSKPLFGYYFIPNKVRQKGAPLWKRNPLVTDQVFKAMLRCLRNQRIARIFRFIEYRLVIVPFQSRQQAHDWCSRVRSGTAWIGEATHTSHAVPWFHGQGNQPIPQDFIDLLKTDKTNRVLFPRAFVNAIERTTVPKNPRQALAWLPTFLYHLTETVADRGKAGTVRTLFDAEISFQVARPSFEARPQEPSLPDGLHGTLVGIGHEMRGRAPAPRKKVPRGPDAEDEPRRKHPFGMSRGPKGKAGGAGLKKAPRQKKK